MAALRLILGDQLSLSISSLIDCDRDRDTILICEVREEASYVRHHKKKIAFLFSAMRHFASELEQAGFHVVYRRFDDADNKGSLRGEIEQLCVSKQFDRLIATEPGEYRLAEEIGTWHERLDMPVEIRPDDRFLCSRDEFARWAVGRKQLRMEHFYRQMRRRYSILMEGDEPAGGKWNYDAANRKPPQESQTIPPPYFATPDAVSREVMGMVSIEFSDHFGDIEPFHFAVTRVGALEALGLFINQRLCQFGDYQDAMIEGEPWMFHSHLSFYLNCGLLLPLECIEAAEQAYWDGLAPLNAVEGFIRQILGWREYVRGVYWLKMPDYARANHLDARRPLPHFYWTANTSMNCLRQCVLETKSNAYAHHIQRLMVLGNFALLAGIDPTEVNEWFLIVYADAYEWVELPNVSGMILYADGGFLASKPYAAGGSYINKMSSYCKGCSYSVSKKNGPKACPFNYLYWDFLARNRDKLGRLQRLTVSYRTYERMNEDKKLATSNDADRFLRTLE